jgi:uncharacterized iron-regulated membrane protein
VLIGLSGSVLVYREAIDEGLNSQLMLVEPAAQSKMIPVNDILAAAKQIIPVDARIERITLPRNSTSAASVTYISETDDLDTFVYEVFVDPYTSQVKGQRLKIHGDDQFSQPLIPILMGFHWTLLLGANKAYFVGLIAIFFFISVLMGFYLWLPANGKWQMGMRVKWRATKQRIIFDVHRVVGFYIGSMLLISLFTGVAMIFKPVTRDIVGLVSPANIEADFGKSKKSDEAPPIDLNQVVEIVDRLFADGRLHWILLPTSPTGVYVVGKQSNNEPNMTKTYRNVGIDQYTGKITQIQDRNKFNFGTKFIEWLFPLHTGEFIGVYGRPIFVLIGLTPFLLFITGLLRWLSKRKIRADQS